MFFVVDEVEEEGNDVVVAGVVAEGEVEAAVGFDDVGDFLGVDDLLFDEAV